jgi:glutamate synthase domain-containing protein 3
MSASLSYLPGRLDTPQLAVKKRFGRYKDESKKSTRQPSIKDGALLDSLVAAWKSFEYVQEFGNWGSVTSGPRISGGYDNNYKVASRLAFRCNYSSDDIDRFVSALLPELQDEAHSLIPSQFFFYKWKDTRALRIKTGIFISALINAGNDQEYSITTQALSIAPSYLGYLNTKHLRISGYGGSYTGHYMSGGEITINGDAGMGTGSSLSGGSIIINGRADIRLGEGMIGGSIICRGDALSPVGLDMQGGKIVVQGNVLPNNTDFRGPIGPVEGAPRNLPHVGKGMKGGEIHIDGNFEISPEMEGGRIFHKGKLVFDK